ncbi:sigma-70 family RNA polymerase sigma factor [Paucibacter sp. DJ2R-2]|uniref:sigma-70 family RNA polymerase sigma factor n=1 Tax=Paucibacter sp. DJ2R-2 TaxID=2893558 RepID=UPI0021E498F8|nr:sigma-70 family RNA polymerase sigma factor [Paucibacter sp. DJ2R-2]MCV2438690.1 sigma-70 family RNA polymerase sigma factor [Paucibacter sp. DJ2R-2]
MSQPDRDDRVINSVCAMEVASMHPVDLEPENEDQVSDPDPKVAAELASLRPQLLKFARFQLRNSAGAEDAVSETMLAALMRAPSFQGKSQFKTWVFGILKHKLIDQLRKQPREVSLDEDPGLMDTLFLSDGHWSNPPSDWGDPERSLQQAEFFTVLEACIDHLPEKQGRAFMLREWMDMDVEEITKTLGVSPGNCGVLLHRARLRLRECLEQKWFSPQRGK